MKLTKADVGKTIKCQIQGEEIEGKIQHENGVFFICQDSHHGSECNDKLGYKHSWTVERGTAYDLINSEVTCLEVMGRKKKEDMTLEDIIQAEVDKLKGKEEDEDDDE